jgi:hypothetical protein
MKMDVNPDIRVRIVCTGTHTLCFHDARTIGVAAWPHGFADRITIHTATGGKPTEFVGPGGSIFGYDLSCPECTGSVRLDLDEGWRQRIVAAADQGNGELNVSEAIKPGGVVAEVLQQSETKREQLDQLQIELPDDVCEEQAVHIVQRQLTDAGLECTEGEALRVVRDARAGAPE